VNSSGKGCWAEIRAPRISWSGIHSLTRGLAGGDRNSRGSNSLYPAESKTGMKKKNNNPNSPSLRLLSPTAFSKVAENSFRRVGKYQLCSIVTFSRYPSISQISCMSFSRIMSLSSPLSLTTNVAIPLENLWYYSRAEKILIVGFEVTCFVGCWML